MSGKKLSSRLSRLRLLFDRSLTAGNMLDKAYEWYGDVATMHPTQPLPYPALEGDVISYGQLLSFVNRLGNTLRDKAGMERYDRVVVYKSNSVDYYFYAQAIVKAGGIAVPVNAGMSQEGLRNYLNLTGARIVITDAATWEERFGRDLSSFPMVDTWVFAEVPDGFPGKAIGVNEAIRTASDRLAPVPMVDDTDVLIAHTSGTTGFPKGVLISNSGIMANIREGSKGAPMTRKTRQLYAWPANHLISHTALWGSTIGNIPLWFIEGDFDARLALDLIDQHSITQYFGFPDTYLSMYEHGIDGHSLASMQLWFSVADASHEVHIRKFTQKGALLRLFGKPLVSSMFVEALGTSEINFGALFHIAFASSKRFDRYVGKPTFNGPAVKVADSEGNPLARGEIGRLMVKGPTLFKGYWNGHDKLHGVYFDGWWWTGDLVYQDAAGRFYHLDREPDVIHTAGGPVYSLVTEEVLMKHPDVSEAAVIAIDHPREGTVPVALVHAKPGGSIDADATLSWANERLEKGKHLRLVHVIDRKDMQRGVTGKVLKRELRERYASLFSETEAAAAS